MRYWFSLLYKTQGKRIFNGVLLAFITAFSGVSLLMLSGWFITATALAGLSISAGLIIIFDMYMPGSGIRFFALSRTVGRYVERLYNHDTILRLVSVFRLDLFKRLSALPMQQLRATTDSEWLSRLTADLDALDSLLLRFTIPPIISIMLIISAAIFVSFIWPELALYLAGFLLFCAISAITLTIKCTKKLGIRSASLLNDMRADVIEHLSGRLELKSHKLLQHHERHIRKRLDELDDTQARMFSRIANIQLLLDFLMVVGLSVMTIVVLHSVQIQLVDGAVAVMLVLMFLGLTEVLQSLPSQFGSWGKTYFSAQRIRPENDNLTVNNEPNKYPAKTLTFTVNKHPNIAISQIKPLDVVLNENELLLISGRSGAGKSTLANILTGMTNCADIKQSITSIVVDGNTQSIDLGVADWYPSIGYVTQSNSVLTGTLAYNLALGLGDISEEKLWTVLQMVELDAWAQQLKNGLDTWLGDTGDQISGGQARRITLARLLLRDPQLVVLDEPFNGIDTLMAARIWHNISSWINQRTLVLLSHERPAYLPSEITTKHLSLDI
ncbi:ATP-binding cassette domain-containing protein [uncultured Paraglaciecola sp.]|uniref:amino acid ABC transporter ATP-binding/permease protein n=1 Tax=uncultured Paraglaciecola sp. TaxID=1765024 RepID=UPI0030DB3494